MYNPLPYLPIRGRTYSLFGDTRHTRGFYQSMEKLTDYCLKYEPDPASLLGMIRSVIHKRKKLKMILSRPVHGILLADILHQCSEELSSYTHETDGFLKEIYLKKLWDRELGTTREQYHLHMLEITLANRINKIQFLNSDHKIALLPYCLQDFTTQCKAAPDHIDYRCRHCSNDCFQNQVSRILKKHQIEPYIWMQMSIKKMITEMNQDGKTLGVLGIACIPELARGLEYCAKINIPVVGIPLDGNRCIRWWGVFHNNSLNLEELEKLVSS